MRPCFLLLCLLLTQIVKAQTPQYPLKIKVAGEGSSAIESASVSLLKAKDSTLLKVSLSDKEGIAEFEDLPEGNYLVSASAVGMQKAWSEIFVIPQTPLVTLSLQPQSKTLKEVTVDARKPFIERKIDRLVLNVENSIVNAGNSALEILEKAPGVLIDQNDNISMKGRGGVIIMIDGKPSPLSGSDLASFLRAQPASVIERIELISNPSARFDASGNAGIINIIMKKDQRLGTNGNIGISLGQGMRFRGNAAINFNHREKKINLFGNYSYNYRKPLNDLSIWRNFFDENGQKTNGLFLFNHMLYDLRTHNARLGMDYYAGKKTILGILINGMLSGTDKSVENQSTSSDPSGNTLSRFSTNSLTSDLLKHYGINLNLKHTIDNKGQELTVDLDHVSFNKTSDPSFITTYYDPNNNPSTTPSLLEGHMLGKLDIYSAKSDYVKPLWEGSKLEAGFKTSFVKADNDLAFYDVSNGSSQPDQGRSNHFVYEENINAAYLSVNREFKKLQIQLGLRAEQAKIKGIQKLTAERIDTSYLRLFPSAFLTYKLHEDHELGLSYSKRIQRPSYTQLNPFQSFIDLTSYNTGNPYLRPEFTHSLELSYTYKQRTTISVSYATTRDEIAWIIKPVSTPTGTVSVETNDNLPRTTYFNVSLSNQQSLTSWWKSITNFYLYKNSRSGIIENTRAENGILSFDLNNNQTFTLPKKWSVETALHFQSRIQEAYAYAKSQWSINAGVQKIVMGGRGTIRLNVSDIFKTYYPRVTSTFLNYSQYFTAIRDTRAVNISFTCRFGKTSVQAARRRTSGVEEEKNRAN